MCKHSTMVSPIHLLLFGAHKVKNINGSIILDDWFVVIKNYNIQIISNFCNYS